MKTALFALLGALLVAGCALQDLRPVPGLDPSEGPDPTTVSPTNPLVIPSGLEALPQPTPGAPNLAEQAVLVAAQPTASIPASEAALVAAASRLGVTPNIRQILIDGGSAGDQALDPALEATRLAALGIPLSR